MFDPTCVYKTPCGWCSKFDKECNGRIGHFQEELIKIDKITDEKTLKKLVEKYSKE